MSTSGSYAFNLSNADLALEVLERVDVRGAAITSDHMLSLNRSVNLVQAQWANRGVNLWKVDEVVVPLAQGQSVYNVDAATVMMLDVYIRNFQIGLTQNYTPAFATTLGSTQVFVPLANHGLFVGSYFDVIIPVSIGGLTLSGFYQVTSVPSVNAFTIAAGSPATSTASGGVVPLFTTSINSAIVQVQFPNHGLVAGGTFNIQAETFVGGLTLMGAYNVTTVIDPNNFTITASGLAPSAGSVYENNGQTQIGGQQNTAQPYDRIMTPISRNDYAALPNKFQQSPPTQYWFDRLSVQPTVTIWPVPDGAGPYQMRFYRVRQLQDTVLRNSTQNADIPYRFQEALCADSARHMAVKWAPAKLELLKQEAKEAWDEAAAEDRERVSMFIRPDLDGYYNGW